MCAWVDYTLTARPKRLLFSFLNHFSVAELMLSMLNYEKSHHVCSLKEKCLFQTTSVPLLCLFFIAFTDFVIWKLILLKTGRKALRKEHMRQFKPNLNHRTHEALLLYYLSLNYLKLSSTDRS